METKLISIINEFNIFNLIQFFRNFAEKQNWIHWNKKEKTDIVNGMHNIYAFFQFLWTLDCKNFSIFQISIHSLILTCFIQVYCYFLDFLKGVWWILLKIKHAPQILLVISSFSKLCTGLFVTIPNALKTIGFISHNFVISLAKLRPTVRFLLNSLSHPLEQRNLLNIFFIIYNNYIWFSYNCVIINCSLGFTVPQSFPMFLIRCLKINAVLCIGPISNAEI